MTAHIFVDNSNIFGGAQRAAKALEPTASWHAIRVYYRHFFALLESDVGRVKTRRALARGWTVRVYSWRAHLSKRCRHLMSPSVDLEIYELDDGTTASRS